MSGPPGDDVWASGARYEPYVGRWSRLIAREFLDWLEVRPHGRWLDVGCGTGALTATILERCEPVEVLGIDRSAEFVEYGRAKASDGRASFQIGDAVAISQPSGDYDAVVSGLVLNFVPAPGKAVAEMARVARREGTVAAYVWDYAGRMEMMHYFWDAAVELDPTAAEKDEARRFAVCRPESLSGLFVSAGLSNVETRAIDVPTTFHDFEDYWTPFLGGQGPAPAYVVSLADEHRTQLRNAIHDRLPIGADGSIHLIARAWAVRARKQSAAGPPTPASDSR